MGHTTARQEKVVLSGSGKSDKPGGEPPDQIIFITMSISHDAGIGATVIKVQDLIKTTGTLKIKSSAALPPGPYLSCIIYADEISLDSILVEHPLYKNVEYVNENNQFARKAVTLDQSEFFLRLQKRGANNLKIVEKVPGALPKEILTIKL